MAGARHTLVGSWTGLVVAVLSNKTIITLTLVLHALSMSEAATGAPLLAAVKAVVGRVALTLAGPGIALARHTAVVGAVAAVASLAVVTRLALAVLGLRVPEVILGAVALTSTAIGPPAFHARARPSRLLAGSLVAAVVEVEARALHTEPLLALHGPLAGVVVRGSGAALAQRTVLATVVLEALAGGVGHDALAALGHHGSLLSVHPPAE
jgi:hypothetical protein